MEQAPRPFARTKAASEISSSLAPTARSTSVITHRSAAPSAARALMVLATALTERGCSPAATVHPPTRSTGAAADEATPHHGTTRTTTTIGAGALDHRARSRHPQVDLRMEQARPPFARARVVGEILSSLAANLQQINEPKH